MERAQLPLMEQLLLATRNKQQLPRLDVAECAYVDLATVAHWHIDDATHYGHVSFFSNQGCIALDGLHTTHLPDLIGWNL